MTTAARLSVVVEAKGVRETSSAIGGVQRSLSGAAKTALKFTAAYAGIRAAGDAIKYVTDQTVQFDRSMRNVNSISGQSSAQFAKLEKSVLKLAGPTAQSPVTLANGLYDLVSSGFKANESMGILKASAIAATAGLTDTATATKAVAAVLNAYHLPASKATAVSDTLFQTVNRGVITFEQLASTIGTVLPFANSLHVNLNQVGAAISTMTKQGIQADHATTYLKNAMVTFLKPNKDLAAAIQKTGAASGEALVQHKGFQGALQAVIKTTDGTKSAIQALFPDIRASAAVFALTGSNAKMAAGDLKGFANTTGATQKVFAEQSKSVGVQWQKLKAILSATAIGIGQTVVPALITGVEAVAKFIGQIKSGTGAGGAFAGKVKEIGSAALSVAEPIGKVALAIGKLATSSTGFKAIEGGVGGLLALKGLSMVVPPLLAVAGGLQTVLSLTRLAVSTGEVSALPGLFMSAISPMKLLAVAAAGLGAAMILLNGHQESEAQAAKDLANAQRDAAQAIRDAQDAALAAADATFGAAVADRELTTAKRHLSSVASKYGRDSHRYSQALNDERLASLRSVEAHKQLSDAKVHAAQQDRAAIDAAKKQEAAAKASIQSIVSQIAAGKGNADQLGKLTTAVNDYSKAQGAEARATNVAALQHLQLQRLLHGGDLITNKNAAAVARLAGVYGKLPKVVQTKISAAPQDALAKLGNVTAKLTALGHRRDVARILGNDDDVRAKVAEASALLASINGKTATTYVKTVNSGGAGLTKPGKGLGALPPPKTPTKAKISSNDPMATTSSVAHQSTGYNALTDKIEHHTAAEWSVIRAKIAKSNAAKRRLAKYRQNYATPGELAISAADIDVADAGLTKGNADDLKANQGRLVALRRRAVELKRKLAKGHLTKRQRVDARNEYAGILGDIGSEQDTIHGLKPKGPTAMAMAQAGLAVNSAIGTPENVIGSLTTIKGLWETQLKTALAGGNAAKITAAAEGLKQASDQLKQAADDQKAAVEAGRDSVAAGNDAALIRAQVDTPKDTTDDLAALNTSLTTDTGYYNDAVNAGDTAGISKWGSAILGLRQSIEDLTNATTDNTQAQQDQIDLLQKQVDSAQRTANIANAQFPEFARWMTGIVMGHGGQGVLRGSTTPAAGRVGSL